MKIWIYLNGLQQGPYTLDQLRLLSLDPSTPVWYDGLPRWQPAHLAPLTAGLFAADNAAGDPSRQGFVPPQPGPDVYGSARQASAYSQMPPRPATYMVWCIILTILCCSPFALAGIVTGAISSSRYNSGDYAGAKSMSTATEWLIIISIIWALIGTPLGLFTCCA